MVRVECQALRVALGLPKSVPHEQVYNEAGILLLWARIRRDACRYLFDSARVPNSTDKELFEGWISAPHGEPTQALLGSVKYLCIRAGFQPSDRRLIAQCQVDPFPPWDLLPPEVKTDIRGLRKKSNLNLLIAHTRELLAKEFAEDFRVYTDGSVMEDGRTAELIAIREALREIIALLHPPPRVTILTDSRSSLEVLLSDYCASRPEVSVEIPRLSIEISKLGTSLLLQWVPAHVGLEGNEKADKAAKRGALGYEDGAMLVPPSTGDACKKIDAAAWEL
ncbi:uncharacterized protein LOC143037728 [Oratosquilla oratoria]|uniref:uncharacterized protein LOC143037728 n=1 Tax=Oratosquilla oratoria TaxID=337810 RepID=UPI003F76F93C